MAQGLRLERSDYYGMDGFKMKQHTKKALEIFELDTLQFYFKY